METAIANQTNTISDLLTYTVAVDYIQSLEEMIAAGEYDRVNGNITSGHFPIKRAGKPWVSVTLFHFNRDMESDVVIAEMDKAGYRPATIEELLALGKSQPDLQREFPIIALGSSCEGPYGGWRVPGLWGSFDDRLLNLVWRENRQDGNYRFLAVRK